ncbi:MAG: hypothetical protein NVV59_08950 [Chitinophagaceae bacterium]|nr:hypothetical protein [Chitinophagaceae bacterium]
MGDDEYVQTDSFLFTIYGDDRTIMMSREESTPISSRFPLREFLDSMITLYDSAYTINVSEADSVHTISFIAKSDTLPYSRFVISYVADSYLPSAFELETLGDPDYSDIPDSVLVRVAIKPVKYRVRMSFENYSFPDDPNVFNLNQYVIYDRFRKVYKPAQKYQGFRLMTNGVGNSDFDIYAEVAPPPEEVEEPF